jgi:hypothetical protein
MKWKELECGGDVPSPRVSHTATFVDELLFVFGGQSRLYDQLLNDLYALDIPSIAFTSNSLCTNARQTVVFLRIRAQGPYTNSSVRTLHVHP